MIDLDKFTLCVEKTERVDMRVSASINNGCLAIEGQDFGTVVEECFGVDEYEYFYKFDKENTERLMTLLLIKEYGIEPHLANGDVFKKLLLERFSDMDGCSRLRKFC